jgi:hypothetical protein
MRTHRQLFDAIADRGADGARRITQMNPAFSVQLKKACREPLNSRLRL